MKITIEHKKPTVADGSVSAEMVSHNVTIDHPFDDMNGTDLARLLFWAMIGLSYHPETAAKAFFNIAIEQGFDPEEDDE